MCVSSVTSPLSLSYSRREEGEVFVEGGGLVLASGGVCVAGNLQHLKKEKMNRLQHSQL